MLAVSLVLLTNVVVRELPFHFTTEVETNPVPFTVRVKPALPGATLAGTSGWLTKGTGLAACARMLMVTKRGQAREQEKAGHKLLRGKGLKGGELWARESAYERRRRVNPCQDAKKCR